jgi:hypothetical protein
MDPKVQEQLNEQEVKIDMLVKSMKKIEGYMRWTFWITMAVVVLPLVIMLFAIPSMISTFSGLSAMYSL